MSLLLVFLHINSVQNWEHKWRRLSREQTEEHTVLLLLTDNLTVCLCSCPTERDISGWLLLWMDVTNQLVTAIDLWIMNVLICTCSARSSHWLKVSLLLNSICWIQATVTVLRCLHNKKIYLSNKSTWAKAHLVNESEERSKLPCPY